MVMIGTEKGQEQNRMDDSFDDTQQFQPRLIIENILKTQNFIIISLLR